MRHTCLAQRNEARLTSITYAWLSLYANSAQRSKPYDDNSSLGSGTIGVVAFCHGFKITDEFFLYREIGLCSRDGYHHLLLSYSPGHDLSACSNETQMSIDEQMKYDHGHQFKRGS